MSSASDNSLVDLGTFDEVIFEHLDILLALNVNCIELLPMKTRLRRSIGVMARGSIFARTTIWAGLSTQSFFKACHARGIRVILDVVMAFFSPTCPLTLLSLEWFSSPTGEDGRNGWGQNLFRFNTPAYDNYYAAREFLCQMAEFWVNEYHIDGFRVDALPDIANWEFVQEFTIVPQLPASPRFPTSRS